MATPAAPPGLAPPTTKEKPTQGQDDAGLDAPPGISQNSQKRITLSEIAGVAPGLIRNNPEMIVPPMSKAPAPEFDPNAPDVAIQAAKRLKKSLPAGQKRKWARLQVQEKTQKRLQLAEGSDNYNIWYHKYYGNDDDHIREKALTRCRPALDSGMTLGDVIDCKFICVHFAKGDCTHGAECKFLHRLPTLADEKHVAMLHDVFGRERHHDHRDDMGGTGSFAKNTRTLYVTGMAVQQSPQADEILARHFGEWGEIEEISVKPKYGCAFVRFTHRFWAEFAKVAMAEQSLDHNEQINVRWAYDDPNPKAVVRVKWETEEKLKDRLEQLGYSAKGEDVTFHMPATYNPVYNQSQTTYGKDLQMYPTTEHQYQQQQQYNPQDYYAQHAEYYKQYYEQYYAQQGVQGNQQSQQSTTVSVTGSKGTKRKSSSAGPLTPEQMQMEAEKRQAEFQRRRQAQLAQNYVQQQVDATKKLDSVLNVIDNVACYKETAEGKDKGSKGQNAKAQYDEFMASISAASQK